MLALEQEAFCTRDKSSNQQYWCSHLFVEKVQDGFRGCLIAISHEVLPVKRGQQPVCSPAFNITPYTHQFEPKFMEPKHSGLTLTEAFGDSNR